jgi:Flp pilus assembly secretin CpaC
MGRSARTYLLVLAALCIAGPAMAATDMVLQINQSQHVHLGGAAANVVVSNPAIADVAVLDAHSVIVIGRGVGVAQITVVDHAGHELLDSRVIVPDPEGRVTLYRGVESSTYRCSPHCDTDGAGGASGGPAMPRPSSVSVMSASFK